MYACLIDPILAFFYSIALLLVLIKLNRPNKDRPIKMLVSPIATLNAFLLFTILLLNLGGYAQRDPNEPQIEGGTVPIPPVTDGAPNGETAVKAAERGSISDLLKLRLGGSIASEMSTADVALIPTIEDPRAVDPQSVCPGYRASDVQTGSNGLRATLTLAGSACNVYGTDIDTLNLVVQYQAKDRLAVKIQPAVMDSKNTSWYVLPTWAAPTPGTDSGFSGSGSDLEFSWSNDPSFSFTITRKQTGDILFSTNGTKIVYENQFIEFASNLPTNYNLYGLGEVIHGLRLGNNLTRVSIEDLDMTQSN